jgi:hypothetical protein
MALSCPCGAFPAPKVSSTNPRSPSSFSTASTISGLMPGKMRRHATCVVSNRVSILNCSMLFGRCTSSQLTLVRIDVVTASGGQLGESKAAKSLAATLHDRLPLKSLLLKYRHTSGITKWPATTNDPRRLSVASFWSSSIGACAPVRTTVLPRFCSMKLSAEQVYAKLSVPCSTTNASKSV